MLCIFHIVVVIVIIIIVVAIKRKQNRFVKRSHSRDVLDDKRQFKYDFNKAVDDFTSKHLKENNIDKEFAQGAVVNPAYSPDGAVIENPTYLVSHHSFCVPFQ